MTKANFLRYIKSAFRAFLSGVLLYLLPLIQSGSFQWDRALLMGAASAGCYALIKFLYELNAPFVSDVLKISTK